MTTIQNTSVQIISSLESAADAFIATGSDEAWDAVVEWMTASYEADGYTGEEIDRMDIKEFARNYVERRRAY